MEKFIIDGEWQLEIESLENKVYIVTENFSHQIHVFSSKEEARKLCDSLNSSLPYWSVNKDLWFVLDRHIEYSAKDVIDWYELLEKNK